MSLIFYVVRRMLARTFGNMPQPQHPSQSQSTPRQSSSGHDVVETIWAGMSLDQLRTTFGTPLSKETIQGGEIWTYANLNGQGSRTSITIQNRQVTSWQDIRDSLPPSPEKSMN